MQKNTTDQNIIPRPPVVVVMGHIDHGKSTLLDYIRKTNVVDREAGGITQHISAYEVISKDEKGLDKKITFLDTPGHEAFSKMRERGAKIADIAILIVSAEDSVKPQTIEAWKTIVASKTPYLVAINKIDKPGANVEKTKMDLAENEIYLENYGGTVPFALISAKTGEGVDELLTLINVLAEMEDFKGNSALPASGYIIEANLDSKRGIQATLIIKNGTLSKGMFVATENSVCTTRIMEDFTGKMISTATFSAPIRLVGFDNLPQVGTSFEAFDKKDEAMEYIKMHKNIPSESKNTNEEETNKYIIPIVLKADVSGTIEAIEKEIAKIKSPNADFKIVSKGVGTISEGDVKKIAGGESGIIIGFNVSADNNAKDLADRANIKINIFDIIYKLTEWLEIEMEEQRPKVETEVSTGKAKVLKTFNGTKDKQIIGGKVMEGTINLNSRVKIMRRDFEIGRGQIVNLEKGKNKTSAVEEGTEFGMMVESKIEIAPSDVLDCFVIEKK